MRLEMSAAIFEVWYNIDDDSDLAAGSDRRFHFGLLPSDRDTYVNRAVN